MNRRKREELGNEVGAKQSFFILHSSIEILYVSVKKEYFDMYILIWGTVCPRERF
jgi:hypothetical protein